MKFSALVLCSMLASANSFAATSEVKCFKELRALKASIANHADASDKIGADSLVSTNYMMGIATELISQPNARVGAYGYDLRTNVQTLIKNTKYFQDLAKTAEADVDAKAIEVEDCLINL